MAKLIKNWKELSKLKSNDKYQIIVDLDMCCGHIIPITDTPTGKGDDFICNCDRNMSTHDFLKHHRYLSTHTFYGKTGTPHILKEYGWDIELDNWDK